MEQGERKKRGRKLLRQSVIYTTLGIYLNLQLFNNVSNINKQKGKREKEKKNRDFRFI